MAADPRLGTMFAGRYRLLEERTRTPLYALFRAVDGREGGTVDVALYDSAWSGDLGALRRIEKDARIVQVLGHPGLLALHDWGRGDDTILYTAAEPVDGPDLAAVLAGKPSISPQQVAELMLGVASGLDAAHAS